MGAGFRFSFLVLLCLGALLACSQHDEDQAQPTDTKVVFDLPDNQLEQTKLNAEVRHFRSVEWTELMPAEDLQALMSPPEYASGVEEGSEEDKFSLVITEAMSKGFDEDYMRAMNSTKTVAELNGVAVRIPGFVVPLSMAEDQSVNEFFLVPYYGACLHMPPPPPNQMIYVKLEGGLKLESLYDPFWLSGILRSTITENDTAQSAYQMEVLDYELYDY